MTADSPERQQIKSDPVEQAKRSPDAGASSADGLTDWAAKNVFQPIANVGLDAYNTVGNAINPAYHLLSTGDLLPKAGLYELPKATTFSGAWWAQNISSGATQALLFGALGRATGGLLSKAGAGVSELGMTTGSSALGQGGEGLSYLGASKNLSLMAGGSLYEGVRDLRQGENSHLANFGGAVVGLGLFGAGNKLSSEFGTMSKFTTRALAGGTGNLAWQATSKGELPTFDDGATQFVVGATLNSVLGAAFDRGNRPGARTEAGRTSGTREGAPKGPVSTDSAESPKNPAGVPSDATVTRTVDKPDGTKVEIYSNGDTVVRRPGEPVVTRAADGRVYAEHPDGRVEVSRSKAATPLDERPLNVASSAAESIGKLSSNFAQRPFVMDNVRYESVEGFYQSLKWPDAESRARISSLFGREAKQAGRGAPKSETFEYQGQQIKFGSPEHIDLMKRAIRESFIQNPDLLEQFKATYPRPIEHKTGRPENPNTAFPNSTFTRILGELREEFVKSPSPVTAGDTRAADSAFASNQAIPGRPINQLLADIRDPRIKETHPLTTYGDAFRDFERNGTRVIAGGNDTVSIALTDGNMLRIGTRELPPGAGSRPFDMPILEQGTKYSSNGLPVRYFIQPPADTPVAESELRPFINSIYGLGYHFTDPGLRQLGYYNGQVKLLDPYAVIRNPFDQ